MRKTHASAYGFIPPIRALLLSPPAIAFASKRGRRVYAEKDKGAACISPKELLSTGRGRKLGFLHSYPEWTVLTTLTPATGQVGFLGHSSSSFRLPFQYGRKIGATSWDKKISFFFWIEALIGQSSPFHWLTRRTALSDPTVRLVHLLNWIEWKERQIHLARKHHRTQSKNPLFLDFDHLWATDCLHLLPQNTGITSSKGMPCSHVRST